MIEATPILDNAFVRLQMAAREAATSPHNGRKDPSAAQALAGNYKKAAFRWNGLTLLLENVHRSVRTGTSPDGKAWSNRLAAHYGEIAGTRGNDGDPIDIFVGLFPELPHVWVINQAHADGTFDEHKCMLGFASEEQARDAYMLSFDRGWTGLMSIAPATITQFKWWLKHGDKSRTFSIDQLPFDGQPAMSKTLWNADAEPTTLPMNKLLYSMRTEDAVAGLLLDAVSMADIMSDPDVTAMPVLDALVVEVSKLSLKMTALQRVMNAATGLQCTGFQISDPVKARGVLQVAVLFELSDGQTVTAWFHNPDTTPSKLMPLDELISWKWMLNKKDITIVVAPERGRDLQVREVARRIMKLAERNGPAFAKANAKLTTKIEEGFRLDSEIVGLEKRLAEVTHQVEVAKQNRIDAGASAPGSTEDEIAAVDALEARIAALRGQLEGMAGVDVHLVAMTAPLTMMVTPGALKEDVIDKIMVNHPDDIEAAIAAHAAYKAAPMPALEDPGVLPEGWTESAPGRMAAWNDPIRGGIVDQNKQSGQWFIIFNNDQIPADDRGFANRAEAFEAFAEGLAKITPAAPVVEPVAPAAEASPVAAEVPAAVAALEIARETAANNEPINRAEGNSEQADLEAQTVAEIDKALEVLAPVVPDSKPERSGTADEQAAADAALAMAGGVAVELGGSFEEEKFSLPGTVGAWSYGVAVLGRHTIRLAASGGGVVQVNGRPFDPSNEVITQAEQVKAAILAIAPPEPPAEPVSSGEIVEPSAEEFAAMTTTAADESIETVKGWSDEQYAEKFAGLEAENYHDAALVLMAKRLGTSIEVGLAEAIRSEQAAAGYLTPELADRAAALRDRLRAMAEPAAEPVAPVVAGDISYRADDMFTTFYPDTAAGEEAWKVINATEGSEGGKVFNMHAASVIEQLRAAGYTVTEAAPVDMSSDELAAALAEPAAGTAEEPTPAAEGQVAPAPADEPAAQAGTTINEPEPVVNKFDSYIAIAADSLGALRASDVERVLTETPSADRDALAAYIVAGRAEFADEVRDVLAELAVPAPLPTEAAQEIEAATAGDPPLVVSVPSEEVQAGPSADEAADRAFLEGIIDGTGDVLSEDTFPRMEPMFAKYPEGSDMFVLLEKAAEAFGNAVQEVARTAMAL